MKMTEPRNERPPSLEVWIKALNWPWRKLVLDRVGLSSCAVSVIGALCCNSPMKSKTPTPWTNLRRRKRRGRIGTQKPNYKIVKM